MNKEVFEELKEIILDYLGEDDMEISEESTLNEDLGLTSLDMISVIGEIEDKFNIQMEDETMYSIKTVKDAVDYIYGKIER